MRRWWLFWRAVAVSAAATCEQQGIGKAIGKVLRVGWFLVANHFRRVSPAVAAERLRRCQLCVLYHAPRQTCGYYGLRDAGHQPMGCLCYLPQKATYARAACWLFDHTNGVYGHDWNR